ncbi:MAG: hypothetical protein KC422_16365 [Trueperaceae bacterium]|nr:hypothetical protein [Trueperaceae bacterium]
MGTIRLFVGTEKGLFIYSSPDRQIWNLEEPLLPGWEVSSVLPLKDKWLLGTTHYVYGATIRQSTDEGKTFTQCEASPVYPEGSFTVNRIWQMVKHPLTDKYYAGVAEAGLFQSDDGENWEEVKSLSDHETRSLWQPGKGGLCLHTILFHPSNPERIWLAMSAVGAFRSDDGGKSWQVKTKGIDPVITDEKPSEVGRCVHKMVLHPKNPDKLFLQYHHGVYASDDAGDNWYKIEEGLPSNFGFPMAMTHDEKLFVIPLESDGLRFSAEGELRVFQFDPSSKSWFDSSEGLEGRGNYDTILRDAMTVDTQASPGVYFGTTGGDVYARIGDDPWQRLPGSLPRISMLRVLES